MLCKVVMEKKAEKGLRDAPVQCKNKFYLWVKTVEKGGLEEARQSKGFMDESLKGNRLGQHSIRLNDKWRAIYKEENNEITIITVVDINAHKY